MNQDRPTDLLSALPRTRPHRRSDKRAAPPGGRKPAAQPATGGVSSPRKPSPRKPAPRKRAPAAARRLSQPAQPGGIPDARRAAKRKPAPTAVPELVGTAVQAVGELAEIGLALTARALRNAVSRLPKP